MEDEEKSVETTPKNSSEELGSPLKSEETEENTTMKEESESSQSSESSGEHEEIDDVAKLVVKIAKDSPDTKEFKMELPEKDEEIEESTRDDVSSLKTEEERTRDELEQKDRDDIMSVEEEEQRREEERREKMKVLLTGYLELKTKKEIEKALLNEKRIISQWLYPFRGAYQKEWALEMNKLKLGFQKALDYKKSHIHAIQRERKLVELNHLWADSAHYRITEELFDFMRMRCEKLKSRYLVELEETKRYYLQREKEIVDKCTKAEERAKVLAFMRKKVYEKTLQETRETMDSFKQEGEFVREKEIDVIKEKHLTYVEMIAQELQTSISPPEHKMDEIRAMFEEWKDKYQDFLRVSEKNRKELEQLGDEIPALEAKVAASRKKLEDLKRENKSTKQRETEEIIRLQKVAKRYESLRPSLRKMITSSEEVMSKLKERKSKLDKIMKLKKLCDQLETEISVTCPQNAFLDPSEETQIQENDCLSLVRGLCSEDIEDQNLLKHLHHKMSKVKLQNQFLQHEIENLRVENMALRSDMKKYLHLITSGEWKRIPDGDFKAMCILSSQHTQNNLKQKSDSRDISKNLQLLDKNCRAVNEKIIKRVEKL